MVGSILLNIVFVIGAVFGIYHAYLFFYLRHHASEFDPEALETGIVDGFMRGGFIRRFLYIIGLLMALFTFFYFFSHAVDLILSGHPEGYRRFRPIKFIGGSVILFVCSFYYFQEKK